MQVQCGIASRRKCEELILDGKVTVNGEVATKPEQKIDENVDVELGFNSVDEQTTLFVEVGMDKTLEIPLKLEAGKDASTS